MQKTERMMSFISRQVEISRPGHQTNSAMEGLRGAAILLVFFVHYAEFNPPSASASEFTTILHDFLFRAGMIGVDLFFVLSGYLIYGSIIRQPIEPKEYARKRIKRIYPVFTFILAIYIILSFAIPSKSKLSGTPSDDVALIFLNFILLPLLPFLGGERTIINASWSLAYEVFYYLCAPIATYILRLRGIQPRRRLIISALGCMIGFLLFRVFDGNDRAMMFVAGVILFDTREAGYQIRLPPWSGALALLSGAAVVGIVHSSGTYPTIPLFCLLAIACYDAFSTGSKFSRVLSHRILRWTGNISYSFYLSHSLLLQAFILLINKTRVDLGFYIPIIPSILFCILGSTLVYLAIERPLSLNQTPKKTHLKITTSPAE